MVRFLTLILCFLGFVCSQITCAVAASEAEEINLIAKLAINPEQQFKKLKQELQIDRVTDSSPTLESHAAAIGLDQTATSERLRLYHYLLTQYGNYAENSEAQAADLKRWLESHSLSTPTSNALETLTRAVYAGKKQAQYNIAREQLQRLLELKLNSNIKLNQWIYYEGYHLRASLGWTTKEKKELLPLLRHAEVFSEKLNHPFFRASIQSKLGRYHHKNENYSQALEHYAQASANFVKINAKRQLGEVYTFQARVLLELELFSEARNKALQAKAIFDQLNLPIEQASSYQTLAQIYHYEGKYSQAINLYLEELELNRKNQKQIAQAISHFNLAENYLKIGNIKQSIKHANLAHDFFNEHQLNHYKLHSSFLLGKINHKQGLLKPTTQYLQNAKNLANTLDANKELMEINQQLLQLYVDQELFQDAFLIQQEINNSTANFSANSEKSDSGAEIVLLESLSKQLEKQKQQNSLILTEYEELSKISIFLAIILCILTLTTLVQRYKHFKGKRILASISDDNIRERYTKLPGLNALENHLNLQTSHTLAIICIEELLNQDIQTGLEQLNVEHQLIFNALDGAEGTYCFLARPGLFVITFNQKLNVKATHLKIQQLLAPLKLPKYYSMGMINLPFLKLEHFIFNPNKLYQIALYACNLSMQSHIRKHEAIGLEAINSASAVMFTDPIFDNLAINLSKGIVKKSTHRLN
ncbi:tetratricopeptide repeat protein [Paraferrimonas sp. SM1919]|uniref:tetratricopeptide repeat protein n=1 Tax=Paraferrimonas sp. SM1919 TaxID=2662263 RepID=UPI0013D44FF9|nr:tetratricopeptide repeat protein [Paraferrimonas sp. SM1919]